MMRWMGENTGTGFRTSSAPQASTQREEPYGKAGNSRSMNFRANPITNLEGKRKGQREIKGLDVGLYTYFFCFTYREV